MTNWRCPVCNRTYDASWGRCTACGTEDRGRRDNEAPRISEQDPLLEALKREHPERERS